MPLINRMPRPISLILDFDGTITRKDTLHLVAKVGYDRQKRDSKSSALTPWQEIVDAYVSDFSQCVSRYRPEKNERKTIESEVRWLNNLKSVEVASATRFTNTGVFKNVTKRDLRKAVQTALQNSEVELRPGLFGLMERVYSHNRSLGSDSEPEPLQVLSVNWSRWFVWSMIEAAASTELQSHSQDWTMNMLSSLSIHANEIQSVIDDEQAGIWDTILPGGGAVTLRTSGDKLGQMLQGHGMSETTAPGPLTIYVGDSATDLECLLAAEVGICIRDELIAGSQKELAETCKRLGISVDPLDLQSMTPAKNNVSASDTRLWWARDFDEIDNWLKKVIKV